MLPLTCPPKSAFLCHSSANKPFVRKLGFDLKCCGISAWVDEWEIAVGDSLHDRISHGLLNSGWFVVVLSRASTASVWVGRELNAALTLELERRNVFVLPVLVEDCEIPVFLRDKRYADFRTNYPTGLSDLLATFGLNVNEATHRVTHPCVVRAKTLGSAKVGSLLAGQPVQVTEALGWWRLVVYTDVLTGNRATGWVKSKYLQDIDDHRGWINRTHRERT